MLLRTTLSNVKKGSYFTFHLDSSRYYIRNHYERSSKRYSYSPIDDVNEEFFAKGSRIVYCYPDDLKNIYNSFIIDTEGYIYKIYARTKGPNSQYIYNQVS